MAHQRSSGYVFISSVGSSRHISTRYNNRIFVDGLRDMVSTRRFTVRILYAEPDHILSIKNQQSPGEPTSLRPEERESIVRYPGIEVDDAPEIPEPIEV